MPNNDDMEHGNSTITPPEGYIEGREISEPEPMPAPAPISGSRWSWIGSPSRSEAQEKSDGISDLFVVTDEDVGASDEDLSDLTDVDIEHDIMDADDDGSLDDLVTVTEEDIMGDEIGQRPSAPPSRQSKSRYRLTQRYQPPTSMGRSG